MSNVYFARPVTFSGPSSRLTRRAEDGPASAGQANFGSTAALRRRAGGLRLAPPARLARRRGGRAAVSC